MVPLIFAAIRREVMNAVAEATVRTLEHQMQLVGKSATEKKLARYKQAQVVTLGDFLRKRLKIVEAKDPKSTDAYRLRALLECFLADLPIADLQPAHFEAYIESREDDDVCGATIRGELHMLSGVVSKAMRSYPGVLDVNPASAKQIDYPEDSDHRNRRLMSGEEEALLGACQAATHSPFLLPMVEIALDTAARQGEIRTLKIRDVPHLPMPNSNDSPSTFTAVLALRSSATVIGCIPRFQAVCFTIPLMTGCRMVLRQRISPAIVADSSGRAWVISAFSDSTSV